MTISLNKIAALSGLCALLAGTGSAAVAQGYGDHQYRHSDQGQTQDYGNRHSDRGQGNGDRPDRYSDRGQAQGYGDRHFGQGRAITQGEQRRLARLHRVYTKDARSGHYTAAERAHLHAQAIRQDLRAQHQDMHQDRQNNRDNRGY